MKRYEMYIDGEWVAPVGGQYLISVNPYTTEPWAEIPDADAGDVDRAVRAAQAAGQGRWRTMLPKERASLLRALAEKIRENADELAATESRDNGKLLKECQAQCRSLPERYHYFAGAADKLHGEVIPLDKPGYLNYTLLEPVGVVAIVVPWNSPLQLLAYKLAPALAAGCTVVAKPAEQTSATALEFARLVEEAGFPPGVFNVVTGYGATAGAALTRHPGVDKISFTGGVATARAIAHSAADNLVPAVFELGGKSPNIVFDDANQEEALVGVLAGIFAATGQTCIAGSRLLLHEKIAAPFLERLVDRAAKIRFGDPSDPRTEMGPVAFPEHLSRIDAMVQGAVAEGATVLYGGCQPTIAGVDRHLFYMPTILTNVRPDMRIAREEVFGPVLAVFTFASEEEAIALANDSDFGLAAGVWTGDVRRAHRVSGALRSGTVWVNTYRVTSYASPFGGFKLSGYGRENGMEGLKEFVTTKSVWIELAGQTRDPFRAG